SHPLPHNADDDVAAVGFANRCLRRFRRLERLRFPKVRADLGPAGELFAQLLDDAPGFFALETNVTRRGDEDAEGFHARKLRRRITILPRIKPESGSPSSALYVSTACGGGRARSASRGFAAGRTRGRPFSGRSWGAFSNVKKAGPNGISRGRLAETCYGRGRV